jgi:voltage-gated potassium channel Kch
MKITLKAVDRERRSMLLLISIVLFFVLAPILEKVKSGGVVLILILYVTLVSATMELAGNKILFRSAIPFAATSMVLLLVSHFYDTWPLLLLNSLVLAAFLLLVTISLFSYLGQKGQITSGRLYISVSLYFLMGLTWFALYNLLNLVEPGSFAEGTVALSSNFTWGNILYFSLATLTTLGYGDIVPIRAEARMLAALESAAGVLYVAITVARLVGAKETRSRDLTADRHAYQILSGENETDESPPT